MRIYVRDFWRKKLKRINVGSTHNWGSRRFRSYVAPRRGGTTLTTWLHHPIKSCFQFWGYCC